MIPEDNRSKRIVYLSHCFLNQNSRGGAFAVQKGSMTALVNCLQENGVGIVQFPCPELYVWGGVNRATLYSKQPFVYKNINKPWFGIFEFFSRLWMKNLDRYCARIAKTEVKRMKNYIMNGYTILGCIGTEDSPTCGVTKIVDLLELMKDKEKYHVTLDELENQKLPRLREIITESRTAGTGVFFQQLRKEMDRNKLSIPFLGYDFWNENQDEEIRKLKDFILK